MGERSQAYFSRYPLQSWALTIIAGTGIVALSVAAILLIVYGTAFLIDCIPPAFWSVVRAALMGFTGAATFGIILIQGRQALESFNIVRKK